MKLKTLPARQNLQIFWNLTKTNILFVSICEKSKKVVNHSTLLYEQYCIFPVSVHYSFFSCWLFYMKMWLKVFSLTVCFLTCICTVLYDQLSQNSLDKWWSYDLRWFLIIFIKATLEIFVLLLYCSQGNKVIYCCNNFLLEIWIYIIQYDKMFSLLPPQWSWKIGF